MKDLRLEVLQERVARLRFGKNPSVDAFYDLVASGYNQEPGMGLPHEAVLEAIRKGLEQPTWKYEVVGGVYTDFTFTEISEGTYESYGPFDTWEAARDVWKTKMWLNVDNGQHRLNIIRA